MNHPHSPAEIISISSLDLPYVPENTMKMTDFKENLAELTLSGLGKKLWWDIWQIHS